MSNRKKVLVIIGGAGRLGQVFTRNLVKNYHVIVFDICDIAEWTQLNISTCEFIQTNMSNTRSISDSIERVKKKYNSIDSVLNTSYPRSLNYGKNVLDISIDDFNENISMHIGGYFNVMQLFVKYFVLQGHGNIINIASIQGISAPKFEHYDGLVMSSPIEYTASKSAIIAMSKYLAKYLKNKNIRLNCISPGGIKAKQDELFLKRYNDSCLNKGMLDAEDIIGVVNFLLSDASKYINGQNIVIDDGWSL
jgi:NAD(P)-dependent dehydrogenase (short-subunit alcohol dehydrogenase family)